MKQVVLAALFIISSPVFAQGYVGIGLGQSSVDLTASPIGGVPPQKDDNDTAFKVFGGGFVNDNVGFELGYVDFGEFTITWDDGVDYIKDAFEGSALYAAAVGYLPIGQAKLFGKAGLARWDVDAVETSSIPGVGVSVSEDGIDLMFGIGAQIDAGNVLLRAEFERFTDVGDEDTTGQSDVDVIGVSAAVRF